LKSFFLLLLRWVVPLCATRQTKVDFKRPTGQKEAQKFTFAYCLHARGKNVMYLHQFHKVPVATESSSLRNLPALALFPHRFYEKPTDDTRLCGMYKRQYNGDGKMSLHSRYWETRLIILTVSSSPPTRPSSHYAVTIILNGPPTCPARLLTRSASDSFHSSFCPEADTTCGSHFLFSLEPQ